MSDSQLRRDFRSTASRPMLGRAPGLAPDPLPALLLRIAACLAVACAGVPAHAWKVDAMKVGQPSPEPTLLSIALSAGEVSPGFSATRFEYTVRLPYFVDRLTVTAEAASPGMTIRVDDRETAGGRPSEPVALPVGRSTLRVEVSSGGAKALYTIKVIRDLPVPTWVRVRETSPWSPRDSAGELVFRDRMWLFGGYTPPLVSDVWSSPDGDRWTQTGTIPSDAGVDIPVNFVFDNRMWLSTADGKFWSSADGVTWTLVSDRVPWAGRYGAGDVVFNGRMWAIGGVGSHRIFNDVWSSSDGVHWTCETEHAPWSPRQIFSMAAVRNGRIWIFGGGLSIYHPFKAYNDVWSSADGRHWEKVLDEAPWPARVWSTVALYRGRFWLLGGFRSEPTWNNFADVSYSADGKHWRELDAPDCWSARHELSAYVFKDRLWVVAGNSWPLMNDVWYLDIPGLCFVTQPEIESFATTEYVYRARADFGATSGPVRYRLAEAPRWLRVDARTGVVRGTPAVPGDFPVTVEARDAAGANTRQSYTLHVVPVP